MKNGISLHMYRIQREFIKLGAKSTSENPKNVIRESFEASHDKSVDFLTAKYIPMLKTVLRQSAVVTNLIENEEAKQLFNAEIEHLETKLREFTKEKT